MRQSLCGGGDLACGLGVPPAVFGDYCAEALAYSSQVLLKEERPGQYNGVLRGLGRRFRFLECVLVFVMAVVATAVMVLVMLVLRLCAAGDWCHCLRLCWQGDGMRCGGGFPAIL